jgi:hypothetical protein
LTVAGSAAGVELAPGELEERRRRAVELGDPHYLWPEVPAECWRAALGVVARVSAAVLAGQSVVRLERPRGVADTLWPAALTTAAFTSGMGPLLGLWQERAVLEATPDDAALLAAQLEHGRARAARMERALHNTEATLLAAGIGVTLIKGTHTARYCFPEPGVRPMSDHDILVDERDVVRAEAVLGATDYELVEGSRIARPYRSTWRPPGAPLAVRSLAVHHAGNPFTVDLHSSLDLDFVGVHTLRWPVRPGQRVPAPWHGSRASVLAQPLLIAHLAAHASLTLQNLTLLRLTELVLLLQRDASRVFGWRDLHELLRSAGAERFVFPAFELVERFVPGTVETALRQRLARAATPALRSVVSRLTPATAHRLAMAIDEMFMWGATPLDHVRRVAYSLVPPAARSPRLLRRLYRDRAVRLLRGRLLHQDRSARAHRG